jgi:hypothetical protein
MSIKATTICRYLKPTAIALGAIFLLVYVGYHEREIERIAGCWDCGWETRQALYLVVAALGLLIGRLWSAIAALALSIKVAVSVSLVAFVENIAEVKGLWPILRSSIKWSLASHPEFFVEIALALYVGLSSVLLIWRVIAGRIHRRGIQHALGADSP